MESTKRLKDPEAAARAIVALEKRISEIEARLKKLEEKL